MTPLSSSTCFTQSSSIETSGALPLLSAAIDPTGWICIVGMAGKSKPIHKYYPPGDYEGAVQQAALFDSKSMDTYFCTSSMKSNVNRTEANVSMVRVFKLDLDVGEGDHKYGSQKEAVLDIVRVCGETNLPQPVFVNSGYGVHVYWIGDKGLTSKDAKLYLGRLKRIMHHHGVKSDSQCTSDTVRILRVPGTHNYKLEKPKSVKLTNPVVVYDKEVLISIINAANELVPPDLIPEAPAAKHAPASQVSVFEGNVAIPAHIQKDTIDESMRSLMDYRPKLFSKILEKSEVKVGCAQIWDIFTHQDEQGNYDRWRAGLSIAYNCEDGEEAIHRISEHNSNYTYEATVAKAKGTEGKPYTCNKFAADWPKLCKGCKHAGKITSPIQLGDQENVLSNSLLSEDSEIIASLAALTPLEYDKVRTRHAKDLNVRATTLDKLVEEARADRARASASPFVEVEAWDSPVDVAALLHEISATVRRFIVCEKEVADIAALWAAMTWIIDGIQIAPLAVIKAPEKRCGKSEFRRLMAKFVYRPLEADGMSASVLFRGFDLWKPTLLIDEFDTFVADDESLRGIVNAGHQRGGCIWRCVGEDHEPKRFNVFGPKLLAGIGTLPGTIMDRSIVFELRRKLPHENVERLRYADSKMFDILQQKLARFAQDYLEVVRAARPPLPAALNDRQADNYEPLLAIADIAGHDWPELARQAALRLSAEKEDATSMATELLADIREIFTEKGVERLFSFQVVGTLCCDERRWCTHNRGSNITAAQVARILKGYGIVPKSMRIENANAKGYALRDFDDAFERYLPLTP